MRENPDCEKYGLRGIWNNMTGEANHRENPITESLCSWPPPVLGLSFPSPGEPSLHTNASWNQKHHLALNHTAAGEHSEGLAAPAAECTRGMMVSSQRQNNTRMSEAMGQGKEERTGNKNDCSCTILANQAQIQMETSREHLREVYISAGFHSWTVLASHAKLISPGYSSREG